MRNISTGKKQTNTQSLNETFRVQGHDAEILSQNVSFDGFLKADEVQKLSTDNKIALVVNKAIVVMNMFHDMKDTLTKYESAIENLLKQNSVLVDENTSMKKRISDLELEVKSKRETLHQDEGMILKYERLKQNMKQDECEIWGVDELTDEDLMAKVIDIAGQFNTLVSSKDVAFVTRKRASATPRQGIPRAIRVKFYNRCLRDELIRQGKTMRVPRSNNMDQRNGRGFIYVNEALTKHMEHIYGKARELKRKQMISKTWCKNGKVFVQWGTAPPKLIERIEDLNEQQ